MKHNPTRWAVPGILPEGVCILAGKPKVGKSWLALDLALSVGAGREVLAMIPVEPGPVLYLALEDTARRLTKRLRILCREAPPSCVEIITECPRLGMGGEDVLQGWLRDHPEARLIVIDTLARFPARRISRGHSLCRRLFLLCQTKILASDHVGKYNVMC